jgi:hypothetical protein
VVLCVGVQVMLDWYDQLGVGEYDGAWLPRSPAANYAKREKWDRHVSAVIQAFSFLFVNQIIGVPMIVDPLYIFATWTQHTTNASNDYGVIFTWLMVTAVILIVFFAISTFLFSGSFNSLMRNISFGVGHKRRGRYGRKRERDEGEAETETGDNEDDDDNDDDE